MTKSLDNIILDVARDITNKLEKKEIIRSPYVVSATGSSAAIFKPEMYGEYVFRSPKEVGDIGIIITTLDTEGTIPIPNTPITVYINSPNNILQIPAAAYSLDPRVSYIVLDKSDKNLEKFVKAIQENIKNHIHPIGTALQLGIKNPNILSELYQINLENLKRAVDYTYYNLLNKIINNNKIPLHDLFKYLGAQAALLMFLKEGGLYLRSEALQKVSPEDYETIRDLYTKGIYNLEKEDAKKLINDFSEKIGEYSSTNENQISI